MRYRAPDPIEVPDLGIHPLVAEIAARRGLTADDLFEPATLDQAIQRWHAMKDLPDLQKAAEMVLRAAYNGQWITVYGDYDADGVTGTAILFRTIRRLTDRVLYVIPDRLQDGYGFHTGLIPKHICNQLIVTCDTGITALGAVRAVREKGHRVVITDHHQPSQFGWPEADAVVTPRWFDQDRPDHPARHLSGAGVALALAWAVESLDMATKPPDTILLGLAAIGTIADVVPLVGINRRIVRRGLAVLERVLDSGEPVGLYRLLRAAGASVTENSLAWRVAPLVNAAGRIDTARIALDLILTRDPDEADRLAVKLNELNELRKIETEKILTSIPEHLSPAIIAHGENWHPGVVGLAATRLAEQYRIPVFLMAKSKRRWVGSARAPEGFPLLEVLARCADYLERWGGHQQAAGFSLRHESLELFRTQLVRAIDEQLIRGWQPGQEQVWTADAVMTLGHLSSGLTWELDRLRPFGAGNPEPIFLLQDAEIVGWTRHGSMMHLTLSDCTGTARAVWFDAPEQRFRTWERVEAAVRIGRPNWVEPLLIVEDIWPAGGGGA